ncbi:MAG: phage capsid protein, partial [Candidatus Thorarchaeota archaeon]
MDLLQTNIQPQGSYVRSAVAALNRTQDDLFTSAFFGTAKTGETGSTDTTFLAGNQISSSLGAGAATGLNIDKLREAQKILLDADVDLDMEQIYIAVAPKQHDDLLALTQVVSTDFNERPVLVDGMVRK